MLVGSALQCPPPMPSFGSRTATLSMAAQVSIYIDGCLGDIAAWGVGRAAGAPTEAPDGMWYGRCIFSGWHSAALQRAASTKTQRPSPKQHQPLLLLQPHWRSVGAPPCASPPAVLRTALGLAWMWGPSAQLTSPGLTSQAARGLRSSRGRRVGAPGLSQTDCSFQFRLIVGTHDLAPIPFQPHAL